jgi:Protein of unknown function (DUF3515)
VSEDDGPPRAVLIAALVLAVATIGAILTFAATRHPPQQPVSIPAVPAPQAASPACQALIVALPQRLGDFERAAVAQPAPDGTSAWRAGSYPEPVVLRCGLERPGDFVVGSPIQVVDRVQWFQVSEQAAGRSTWYTVDRQVYVALTLPANSGPTPIQELSAVIDHTIAEVPIDPAPVR